MLKAYRIREFDSFTRQVHIDSPLFTKMPAETFDRLERFILENRVLSENEGAAWEFLSLSVKHGVKVISAKNYVGLITMNDGTTIEIMPKVDAADEKTTRRIFLDMLRTVKEIPYRTSTMAAVMADDITLYEVFMRMFLNEVNELVKRGVKFGYVAKESNEQFLKGRLDFNQQIRQNLFHKERFYVSYDEFEANRPENKLIKSTLVYVWRRSHDSQNKRMCRRIMSIMDEIDESTDYEGDFSKYSANRNMQEYDVIMRWCRVFLMNKSFTPFRGKEIAFALLFPMEKLFESYVADRLRHHMDRSVYQVRTQDNQYHLFDQPKKFSLRPDIVVANNDTGRSVVLDTKWKILSPCHHNYGIAQADMYQMYAYHKKYQPQKVVLVYPYNQSFDDNKRTVLFTANDPVEVNVQVMLFDLTDVKGSLTRIEEAMNV